MSLALGVLDVKNLYIGVKILHIWYTSSMSWRRIATFLITYFVCLLVASILNLFTEHNFYQSMQDYIFAMGFAIVWMFETKE